MSPSVIIMTKTISFERPVDYTDLCFELSQRITQGTSIEKVKELIEAVYAITLSPSLHDIIHKGKMFTVLDTVSESNVIDSLLDALRNGRYDTLDEFKHALNAFIDKYYECQRKSFRYRFTRLSGTILGSMSFLVAISSIAYACLVSPLESHYVEWGLMITASYLMGFSAGKLREDALKVRDSISEIKNMKGLAIEPL